MNGASQWRQRATGIGLCETAHAMRDAASTLHMAAARRLANGPPGAAMAGARMRRVAPDLRCVNARIVLLE